MTGVAVLSRLERKCASGSARQSNHGVQIPLPCNANIGFAYRHYQEQGCFAPRNTYTYITTVAHRRFLQPDLSLMAIAGAEPKTPKTIRMENVSAVCYAFSMAQNAMTQTQIVKAIAEECEIPNAKARQILTFLSDTAIREVKKNGLFVVPGLGRLVRVERKA